LGKTQAPTAASPRPSLGIGSNDSATERRRIGEGGAAEGLSERRDANSSAAPPSQPQMQAACQLSESVEAETGRHVPRSSGSLQLLERALARGFVGPPADEFRSMAEAIAADVIVAHLRHEDRPQRLPFG
jgi:hypothetical protein